MSERELIQPTGSVCVNLTYDEDEGWSDGYKSYPALASPLAELFRFRGVKHGMRLKITLPNANAKLAGPTKNT